MKNALMLLAVVGMTGCAGPKALSCNKDPQYWGSDSKGVVVTEIRVCFWDNYQLLWDARPVAQVQPPAPAPAVQLPTLGGTAADAQPVKPGPVRAKRRKATK